MDLYRLGAIAVGCLIFAWPMLPKWRGSATLSLNEITVDDLVVVLNMATRLRKIGCVEGAKQCQALMDTMMNHGVR